MNQKQIEIVARVCHEANRGLCEATGDTSQKSWAEAADWQRESAISGVRFALENPNAPAAAQHNAWLADKARDGWQFGAVKNADKKEHPCIVPYEQLPAEQRWKDHLFRGIVRAMWEAMTD